MERLPLDMLIVLGCKVEPFGILKWLQTCKAVYRLSKDNRFWKAYYIQWLKMIPGGILNWRQEFLHNYWFEGTDGLESTWVLEHIESGLLRKRDYYYNIDPVKIRLVPMTVSGKVYPFHHQLRVSRKHPLLQRRGWDTLEIQDKEYSLRNFAIRVDLPIGTISKTPSFAHRFIFHHLKLR